MSSASELTVETPSSPHKRTSWGEGLRNHFFRLARASLGSEFLPAFARNRLMRGLGFDLDETVCIWSNCSFRSNRVYMAARVFINVGFFHDGSDHLSIGENVRIGQFVRIITGSHAIGPASQRCTMDALNAPVSIEAGCWIGAGVMILPGVTVARGCVVGAGSVIVTSTEPNGLYVGSPAKRIRDLETVETLGAAATPS